VACANIVGLPIAGALGRLAEAALDLDAGAAASAAKRALYPRAGLEEVGDAYHASRARMLAGRAFAQAGEAAEQFERVAAAFDSFGAERELQLARLVVDRKTNPQIAGELFLSPQTVETHLRNIFRKLGVANRVELARAVEQADRAASSGR